MHRPTLSFVISAHFITTIYFYLTEKNKKNLLL